MTVTAKVYVTGRTLGQLADAVSTAIGAGQTPDGPAFLHEGMLVQGMQTGAAPTSVDGIQTSVASLQAQSAIAAFASNGHWVVSSLQNVTVA